MSHYDLDTRLRHLDTLIDRCRQCGAWRWRRQCRTCWPLKRDLEGAA